MDPFSILIYLAISVGLSLLAEAVKPKPPAAEASPPSGVRGSLTLGGDEALSFIIGRYATAGHKEYAGTWGNSGETPNAYLTQVISLSDLPVRGLAGVFVDGARMTLAATPTGNLGNAVVQYQSGGLEHLWVKFYDGTQTTADPLLLAAFGADPDRPWLSDMIGRGVAYVVVTALSNRTLFAGVPDYFFEVDGIALDDPRTGTANDNPVVMIHQVLSGISYSGEWVWGLQGLPATRLPSANWAAQMDKCDVAVALAGGGTEPQFRAGAEIRVDQQPIEIIGELLNSCSGRIAEIGGIYKVLVGAPDAAVVSFTDEDIVITEGQSYEPFPGLESSFNGVNFTYTEPAEKWGMHNGPAISNPTLEAEDDDRKLPASVSFPLVYSGTQAQRLAQAMHLEDRRFRLHNQTMPPEFWEYEVLDAASWSSERNGYEDKVFLINVMDDLPNGNQFMSFKEQDATDYDWDEATDEQDYDVAPLVISRPPPQEMTGWAVAPYVIQDAGGNNRRPAIEVFFAGGLQDVRAVRVQVRLADGGDLVFDGEVPYDITELTPSRVLSGGWLLPNEDYEVSGILLPFSGRATEWSAWLDVTTPNVKLGAGDIDFAGIIDDIVVDLHWVTKNVRKTIEDFERLGTTIAEQDLAQFNDRQSLKRELLVKTEALRAGFVEIIEAAIGPGGAIATKLESLYASMGGNTAEVNIMWQALAGPAGYAATYAVAAAVDDGTFRAAAFGIDVPASFLDPTRFWVVAEQCVFLSGDGTQAQNIVLFNEDGAYIPTIFFQNLRSIAQNGGVRVVEIDGDTGYFSFGTPA